LQWLRTNQVTVTQSDVISEDKCDFFLDNLVSLLSLGNDSNILKLDVHGTVPRDIFL